jgi:predicted O-methyltransferase YrrM
MIYLSSKEKLAVAGSTIIVLLASTVGFDLFGVQFVPVAAALIVMVLAFLQLNTFRVTDNRLQQLKNDYSQIESLFSLFSLLKIRCPLPPMREWAISPDFANLIVSLMYEHKPKVVVEASSGVSTLVIGYCLEQLGEGKVTALEHDERFAFVSTSNVIKHGLQSVAQVVHAPLTETFTDEQRWLWYDTSALKNVGAIEMLVIDGPPSNGRDISRYPALPVLFPFLKDDAIIILDDGARREEKDVVLRWLKSLGNLTVEEIQAEKGAIVLRKHPSERVIALDSIAQIAQGETNKCASLSGG